MSLSPELREKLTGELKEFSTSLNLSENQMQKMQESMSHTYRKMQEYKQQNPGASKEDLVRKVAENRDLIRQRLVSFLTPDQLTKWDIEIAKAKDFLTQRAASA